VTPRLDLGKVIAGAFLVPWWHRKAFARALTTPLALIVLHVVVWYYYALPIIPGYAWLVYAVYGLFFTIFAVTCHRLVLLDAESVARRWQPTWSMRETRFFLWIVVLWVGGLAAIMVVIAIAANIWTWIAGTRPDAEWTEWVVFALKIPALYIFARLCVLFPAMALDRKPNLRWAWDLTQKNGWRLMVVVAGLPVAFKYLVGFLYRDDATRVEWLVLTVVAGALVTVEIAAISLAYRELTRHDPQSTAATT
jgi:hypothetical protein